MPSLKACAMKTYSALQRGSTWLKTKLSRGQTTSKKASPRGPEGRSLSIVSPLHSFPLPTQTASLRAYLSLQAQQLTWFHSQGPPTDFRREAITLGTDVDGNAMLVEQAREDAQKMHNASKEGLLRKHGRKISARFGGGAGTGGEQLVQGGL